MNTSPTTRPAHRYTTVGHTITDHARRRDCTSVYQTVEFSARTGRIRVEHMTRWQGSRYLTWYFDAQTHAGALALLERIREEGRECLGVPDRRGAVIR